MSDADQRLVYDEMPYPDLTYGFTHPGRLLAIAALLGLEPADVSTARVLELGCASGGNLGAMAYSLPGATFVGVDFSEVQISRGRRTIEALGLTNVELHHADLVDVGSELGPFDVVVAHGLYSWVPLSVRDRLVALVAEVLTPRGVGMISFNCWPGWAMPAIVREMMLYRARHAADPRQQVQQARELLAYLTQHVPRRDDSAYAAFLDVYAADCPVPEVVGDEAWADAGLLHDELDPNNRPCWFHEFAAHLDRHGLDYLADAMFSRSMVHDLAPEAVQHAAAMASDAIEFEQYLDYLRNAMFRRAVVCRAGLAGERRLRADRIVGLSVATSARVAPGGTEPPTFVTPDGTFFSSEHPLTSAAFAYLVDVAPASVPFEHLVTAAASLVGGPVTRQDVSVLAVNLVGAFGRSAELVDLRTDRPAPAIAPADRPRGSGFARRQASIGHVVTSLRHDRVELDPGSRSVLLAADGTRGATELALTTGLEPEQLGYDIAWLASVALLES
jgi:SAM-dependent methyltransferase